MTEWLRIMLDEIARRRAEREASRAEDERRKAEQLQSRPGSDVTNATGRRDERP